MFAPKGIVFLLIAHTVQGALIQRYLDPPETFKGSDILAEVPLVDGHNDLPWNIKEIEHNLLNSWNLDSDLRQNPKWSIVNSSHTDIPRLRKGQMGAQFWSAYVDCLSLDKDALEQTLDQIDVIHRFVRKYSRDFEMVTTASGILDAFQAGKIGSLIGVEGGHSIDDRLGALRMFYEMGVRYMTLTHTCVLPWADPSPVDDDAMVTKRNLTEWGKQVVAEMNRLGMMVDLSHVSYGVMADVLDVTKAPVIFSHSSAYGVYAHHRNVHDDILLRVKENGGVVMINFYPGFVGGSTLEKLVEHFNHIRNLIGAEHIGVGGDFDGVSSVNAAIDDVSKYPLLFDRLAEAGHGYEPWTEQELKGVAGLNLIRVMTRVEEVRDGLRGELPVEERIPYEDLVRDNPTQGCRTDLNQYKPPQARRTPLDAEEA